MTIILAPPDDPAREHGLTLRKVGRVKRGQTPPTPTLFVSGSDDEDPLDKALAAEPPMSTKAMKRASSVSILSGLGVSFPEKSPAAGGATQEGPPSPTSAAGSASPTKSFRKGPSKLRNFFGQRPPSELITNHLQEYFPFTEKRVLERTRRQSIMRQSGLPGRRDSIISFNMNLPSQSRFSVSTIGSQRTTSTSARMSTASSASAGASVMAVDKAAPEPSSLSEGSMLHDPPRVSLSTDDGHSVDLSNDASKPSQQGMPMSPHLLPPVAFPSESLSESLNLSDSQSQSSVRSSRRMSTASKRMSYITELRSKRDRSDTASLMTVDEITAEVESRQETAATSGDSDEWTKVDVPDDKQSMKDMGGGGEEEDDEDGDEEYEEEEEEGDEGVPTDEDESTGQAIMSKGKSCRQCGMWVRNQGADLTCMVASQARRRSSGSKVPSSALVRSGKCILEWTPRQACSWQ